ncbi:MAG TPA: HEAT repeat domain-containing protein [Allosphingosinicella sp.]|jgi:hypothetical protein
MKANPKLNGWLSDPGRRQSAQQRAEAFTERWSSHPLFAGLTERLRTAEARSQVLEAAERFLDRVTDVETLVSDLIAQALAEPFLAPPLTTVVTEISTGYVLFADPKLTISLGVISPDGLAAKKSAGTGTTAITFTGLVTSYRFLKSGGATMAFYGAPACDSDFTGDIGRTCSFAGRRRIGDGEALLLDGSCQSLVIEHLASDMLCLQASVQVDAAPLSVDYDSRTFRYLGAASTDEASSRTQMMITLLRCMDRVDAMPVIEQALASPHFHTRWHVMREMLALDAEAALPSLRHMARADPHPEVRFAATQALDLFFNEESEELQQCRA